MIYFILLLCALLLAAYIFDISSRYTKIPTVIFLLATGMVVREFTELKGEQIATLNQVLPIFGTIGLILIVLEGALELELNRSKLGLIKKSALMAFIPMCLFIISFAFAIQYFGQVSFHLALLNAVPLGVISSAIAIPSSQNLHQSQKEFIIYESSLSDIFGVLIFNYILMHDTTSLNSVGSFALQIVLKIVVSFISVILLSYLMGKIKHHVTYTPVILLVLLIYCTSKLYHLPGLLFILIFGLFLGNLDEMPKFNWIKKVHPEKLNVEVRKFKEITIEATFLIKSLFFILFGYLLKWQELINWQTAPWALFIIISIMLIRFIMLKLLNLQWRYFLFIAPRGLITILLFLSIPLTHTVDLVNRSLVVQVIVLSILLMMPGLVRKADNSPNSVI